MSIPTVVINVYEYTHLANSFEFQFWLPFPLKGEWRGGFSHVETRVASFFPFLLTWRGQYVMLASHCSEGALPPKVWPWHYSTTTSFTSYQAIFPCLVYFSKERKPGAQDS